MKFAPVRYTLLCLVITAFGLMACNSAESTPEQAKNEPAVAEAAQGTSTVTLPTASPATETPTQGPPTKTPTRVIKPSATPTPLPPSPTPAPQVYVVEEYDTLLAIAVEFDTTVEALTTANGINENDFLQIGQELIIFALGQELTNKSASVSAAQAEVPADVPSSQAVDVPPTSDDTSSAVETDQTTAEDIVPQTESADVGATVSVSDTETVSSTTVSNADVQVQSVVSAPVASPPPEAVSRSANINPLTGLPVDDPAKLQRRPLMVRIGNDAGARTSQAGLNSADVVYEEITEWWVTRFTAIFLSETPNMVAPIRSARLINVQLVPQYQGALAHSGGSDPVRWEISQAPIVNLDEFYNPAPYYYRSDEGWQTRLAIDAEAARDYMAGQGTDVPVSLHGFLFSETVDTGDDVTDVFVPYPRSTSFTQWHYDLASSKYLRFASDLPLYDANGLGQVAADNVIVYFAEHQETDIVEDSNGATSIRTIVNGTGPAWFFRDGKLNKGYWQTDGTRTPYFMVEDGSPYYLKPGNTWLEVVPTYYTIGLDDPSQASARP